MLTAHKTPDPTVGQSLSEITAYFRAALPETEVAIRNTQGGILAFLIAKVVDTKPRVGRIYTDKSGLMGGNAWYAKSGKSCLHPTGQSRLFIPTDAVRAFLAAYPHGLMTYNTYTPEIG
jgi:hypothetical protein